MAINQTSGVTRRRHQALATRRHQYRSKQSWYGVKSKVAYRSKAYRNGMA